MRRIFLSLLLSLFVIATPLSGDAEDRAPLIKIQEVRSPDGITAWLVEDHSVPVIAVQYAFRGAGSAQDPQGKQGLARMASNTMDEGAGELNSQAFQKELRDRVITLNFGADRDHFNGTLKTLTKNKDRAFELLSLALSSPRFDAEAIERMRAANESRIRTSLSDPEWMAARIENDKAFSGHPYAMNSGGTLSSLPKIGAKDLQNFHKNLIGRNNLIVAVAGDIGPKELAGKLDSIFAGLPEVKVPAIADLELQNPGRIFLHEQDTPQTIIEIAQPGIARRDPDYQTAQVMNFILGSSGFGSRLTEEIREKRGLTYGIYSGLQTMDHANILTVSTSTANANAGEMLGLIRAEFTRMKGTPVTAKELEDAKAYLIGSLPLTLTSTDKIADLVLSLRLDGLPRDYLDIREQEIRAVNAKSVRALAGKLLSPENFVTVLVGKPEGMPPEAVKTLEIVATLPNVQ